MPGLKPEPLTTTGAPTPENAVPMDKWTPDEVEAHIGFMNDFATRLEGSGELRAERLGLRLEAGAAGADRATRRIRPGVSTFADHDPRRANHPLLLATASKDVNQKPIMFAAVRRGLLMEELVRGNGDEELRGEMFICGVFSLLDRMFQQPFKELLGSLPVPQRVYEALVDGSGPYQPYIEMVRAVESQSLFDFRESAEKLLMSVGEINRAQLKALTAASELE